MLEMCISKHFGVRVYSVKMQFMLIASAATDAENEEMPVGSPLADHEFVSDSFQTGSINADELKKEMDQLGMSDVVQDSSGRIIYLFTFCVIMVLNRMNQVSVLGVQFSLLHCESIVVQLLVNIELVSG